MNEPLILTIDFGTQSVRVSLFNKQGDIVAMEVRERMSICATFWRTGWASTTSTMPSKTRTIITNAFANARSA